MGAMLAGLQARLNGMISRLLFFMANNQIDNFNVAAPSGAQVIFCWICAPEGAATIKQKIRRR